MKLSLYDYCIAQKKEQVLEEWDASRNPSLSPETVRYGSQRRVWWTCEKGHQWEAMVKSRAGGTGCPYCSNRLILPGENDHEKGLVALPAGAQLAGGGVVPGAGGGVPGVCGEDHRGAGK